MQKGGSGGKTGRNKANAGGPREAKRGAVRLVVRKKGGGRRMRKGEVPNQNYCRIKGQGMGKEGESKVERLASPKSQRGKKKRKKVRLPSAEKVCKGAQ